MNAAQMMLGEGKEAPMSLEEAIRALEKSFKEDQR